METLSLFVLLLFLCYVIYDDVWERRYKWDTTKQRASDASSKREKQWRRKSKIGKRERKNKKERTTDAPVVVVVPRGIFPFPFQRRALLRSRDPHNNVLVLVVIIVVIIVVLYYYVECCVFHNQQNRLKNEKTEKKSFAGEMSIFKPSSSSLYIIHNAREERVRD